MYVFMRTQVEVNHAEPAWSFTWLVSRLFPLPTGAMLSRARAMMSCAHTCTHPGGLWISTCICSQMGSMREREYLRVEHMRKRAQTRVQVEVNHAEPAWFLIWFFSCLFLLPTTCRLKSVINSASARANATINTGYFRVEELGLLAFFVITLLIAAGVGGGSSVGEILGKFLGALVLALIAELVSLVWKYFCCRVCCSCCLPPGYDGYGPDAKV